MFPKVAPLKRFISQTRELELLLSHIQQSPADFWLVGGCLRNFLLDIPQTDIDIASSVDPSELAKRWAAEVGGHWFWLDKKRKQSRVLLSQGLVVDFNPLRASSIEKDLQLRDFTVNSLALLLDNSFPESPFLDPLFGFEQLKAKQLRACSTESFSADPLRIIKGIRHAVILDFEFDPGTWKQLCASVDLLADVAGERIRDELGKILSSSGVANGVQLLYESGALEILLGFAGSDWNIERALDQLAALSNKLELYTAVELPGLESSEQFSVRGIILFVQLIRLYAPADLSALLHEKLHFSRRLQNIVEALQREPELELLAVAGELEDNRRQALLVEQLEPFSSLKMLFWGVCADRLDFSQFKVLLGSFAALQHFGRIAGLLNGKKVEAILGDITPEQIGFWQLKLKLAEINGEISSSIDAETWLKEKLLFDNQEA